jgi:hypothetical protein
MKKIEYQTRRVRSCFNRVIELNQKMFSFTEGLITSVATVDSEAPASSNTSVTSLWPLNAAQCRGVPP